MNHEFNKEANDLLHKQIFEVLARIEKKGEEIEAQVKYTNGKVKKLYLLLTAVGAFSVGIGIIEAKTFLAVFL